MIENIEAEKIRSQEKKIIMQKISRNYKKKIKVKSRENLDENEAMLSEKNVEFVEENSMLENVVKSVETKCKKITFESTRKLDENEGGV